MVVVDQCLYVVGGTTSSRRTNNVWRLHMQRKKWAELPSMIDGRGYYKNHTVAVHNGHRLVAISSNTRGCVESLVLPSTEGKAVADPAPPIPAPLRPYAYRREREEYKRQMALATHETVKTTAVWQALPPMNSSRDQATLLLC